ncbi:xanthine dehydrogenase family protein molybdopterin-binding subunit [Ammoniphilus sp. CFH 90114]|uniref:xanthine dehydrogenase family protein molybdopterin-binding subunit n=1 Tax=Ammoniphilus sp. CFH 90114 TaxID=2493665 RepID=UPI00100DD68A|nr:xanthine dehydrogenase family protein molybdopterin-binding subunit [Ammoniphilus sp. CFH 90114]RXT13696.1 xanthine dehydrogenase family protein molybdopterin-binding subunit [Ammoniphilus sp. CFH 90114]
MSSLGKPMNRVEDARLLTGKGTYIDDLPVFPNTKQVMIMRSTLPHARIKSIDVSEALKMAGVEGILTGQDLRQDLDYLPVGVTAPVEYYPIAIEKVRYVGEPIAVIVAKNRYIAEDAMEKIKVEYDPLPAVVDVEQAAEPDAPILHEQVGSNVANHRYFHYGNADQAFAEADHIIKHKFKFPKYSATPVETYGVLASYDHASEVHTVHANFHGPFILHSLMAKALKVPSSHLRLITPKDNGGSYGIKAGLVPYIVLMSAVSKKLGLPVKWIEDRQEHLMSSSSGTDRVTYIEAAVKKDGKVTGFRMKFIDNVGAYIRAPEPACLYRNHGNTTGAYDVANLELETMAVMSNKCPTGLIRGYGGQQTYFPLERMMHIIAQELQLDPVDVIRKNLIATEKFPFRTATGGVYDSGDYVKAFNLVVETGKYQELRQRQEEARKEGRHLGIGFACIVEPSGSNMGYVTIALTPEERAKSLPKSGCPEAATVSIDPMGNVTVRISTTPSGQGHETVTAQIVSDVLGIPAERIRVIAELDTNTSAWSIASGSYSSRFAALGSSAVYHAAGKVKAKLIKIASSLLHTSEDELELQEGKVFVKEQPEKQVPLRRLTGLAHWNPADLPADMEAGIYETAYFSLPQAIQPDENDLINSSATYGFVADLVLVEVMPDTGEVRIEDYFTVHDAGTLLNPKIVDGQIYGGLAHGIGGALYEELMYDHRGQFLTGSFMDYLCPTAPEIPRVTLKHIETPSPLTPLGAKGLGEGNTMSAPAAVANAVSDALEGFGVKIDTLPLSPNYIWKLLR